MDVKRMLKGGPLRIIVFLLIVAGALWLLQSLWPSAQSDVTLVEQSDGGGAATSGSVQHDGQVVIQAGGRAAEDAMDTAIANGEAAPAQDEETAVAATAAWDAAYWAEARLGRDRTRSEQTDLLQRLATDSTIDATQRQSAQEQLLALGRQTAMESEIEEMIKAKGYPEAIVYLYDSSAVAIIASGSLTRTDVARIGDIVSSVSGLHFDQIRVMAREYAKSVG